MTSHIQNASVSKLTSFNKTRRCIAHLLGFVFLITLGYAQGVQNRPPQDVPLGHGNYFEQKAIESLWAHQKPLMYVGL